MSEKRKENVDELLELTRTLLIAQLGLAGVPQKSIRAVAKCDINRVSEIMKHISSRSKSSKSKWSS